MHRKHKIEVELLLNKSIVYLLVHRPDRQIYRVRCTR